MTGARAPLDRGRLFRWRRSKPRSPSSRPSHCPPPRLHDAPEAPAPPQGPSAPRRSRSQALAGQLERRSGSPRSTPRPERLMQRAVVSSTLRGMRRLPRRATPPRRACHPPRSGPPALPSASSRTRRLLVVAAAFRWHAARRLTKLIGAATQAHANSLSSFCAAHPLVIAAAADVSASLFPAGLLSAPARQFPPSFVEGRHSHCHLNRRPPYAPPRRCAPRARAAGKANSESTRPDPTKARLSHPSPSKREKVTRSRSLVKIFLAPRRGPLAASSALFLCAALSAASAQQGS